MNFSPTRLSPPGPSRFRVLGWIGVVGLVLTALLVPASPALSNDTLGNNGAVKIHEGDTENDPGEVRNEPHVCTFHLHFFFADPVQSGEWHIEEWAPDDKGVLALSGTYDTAGDGEDRQPGTGTYSLPDGHYKLFWDGDPTDLNKHKVFWVTCDDEGGVDGETSSPTPTATSTTTPTPTPEGGDEGETGTPTPTPEGEVDAETGTPTPLVSASPTPPGGGVLAETGTPAIGGPGVTLPPTDQDAPGSATQTSGWRAIFVVLAAVLASTLVLTPSNRGAGRR